MQALALGKLPRKSSADLVATLDALARTQRIFGKKTVLPLRSIVEGELAPFSGQTNIAGCETLLTPAAGQDFSIIIHELATNALKYGALSDSGGTVAIEGQEDEAGMFRFSWSEEGGPPITTRPQRAGFGQRVLMEIAKGLRAEMTLDYAKEGLRYELLVPVERITNLSELTGATKQA